MKYYLDTEFIEGFHKPLFGKRRHHIDLISVAIVCEDGTQFYEISSEYNYDDADEWVKKNVILPLYLETVHGDNRNRYEVHNFHKHYGRTNKEIALDIMLYMWRDAYSDWLDPISEFISRGKKYGWHVDSPIEFYGYYCDYDWVLICSLFGRMIDLPHDFPMYCRDLKQTLDEKQVIFGSIEANDIKKLPLYPKQSNEHSALHDAKWNKQLHKFLEELD